MATPETYRLIMGRLRVALLEADGRPIAGYGLNESDAFSGDSVRWTGRADAVTDRPVRVLLEMRSAGLYSISSPVPAMR
jgi:hypothetical protein